MSGDAAACPHALRLSRSRRLRCPLYHQPGRMDRLFDRSPSRLAWELQAPAGCLVRQGQAGSDHCSTITAAVIQLQQQCSVPPRPHEPIIGATACCAACLPAF